MGLSIIRNLGNTPIIDIPTYDVVQTTSPATTQPVTNQPAPPDVQKSGSIIDLVKQGAIAKPVDLTKMGAQAAPESTTTQTASPFFKYAAIGLGGLGVFGLIWFLAKMKHSERAVYQNPKKKDIYAEQLSMIEKSTGLKIQDDDYILTDPIHKTIISISHPEGDRYKKIYPLSNPRFPISMENPRGQMKMRIAPYLEGLTPEAYKLYSDKEYWEDSPFQKTEKEKIKNLNRIAKAMLQAGKDFEKMGYQYKTHFDKEGNIVIDYWTPTHEPVGFETKPVKYREVLGMPAKTEWEKAQEGETERINKELGVTSKLYDRYVEASNNARLAGRISESRRWMKLAIESLPPISNPYNPAEKVFTDFHGFEPTKLKEVSVPDGYPDELVLIGKADHVYYRSNKKNGAPNRDGNEKSYVHDFKKGSLWATDKEGKGLYLIDPKLEVKPEGLVH